jgi:two-component system, OmpR family, sensor kinase
MLRGKSLFRQTIVVLFGAVLLSHLVVFLALVTMPQSGPRAITIGQIAQALAEPGCAPPKPGSPGLPVIEAGRSPGPPQPKRRSSSDANLEAGLAAAIGAREGDVRLLWPRKSEIRLNHPVTVEIGGRLARLDHTVFLAGATFAKRDAAGWCIKTLPPPAWTANWRSRAVFITALSLAAMLLVAWLFARRLSHPIRKFAAAADRIGGDSEAPAIAETGPEELRLATRALNAMQQRIRQQLEEREAMIAAIAHDLRTPLARIAFRVESAAPELRDPVQRDIGQMKAMIAEAITLTGGAGGDAYERLELGGLLRQMIDEERATGHQARLSLPKSTVVVSGDALALRRLLQNLIDNARKFGASAEVALDRIDGQARVTIADRGPGIAPDRIEAMFTPFVRGEPSRNRETGGVGLGLSIARAIARRHGGDLHLAPRRGGGLIARLELPTAEGA